MIKEQRYLQFRDAFSFFSLNEIYPSELADIVHVPLNNTHFFFDLLWSSPSLHQKFGISSNIHHYFYWHGFPITYSFKWDQFCNDFFFDIVDFSRTPLPTISSRITINNSLQNKTNNLCDKESRIIEFLQNAFQTSINETEQFQWNSPSFIVDDHHIISLNLINLQITELPSYIKDFDYLEELYLGFNYINDLPNEIYRLSSLKRLYLNFNYLYKFPYKLFSLPNLQILDLSGNLFQFIELETIINSDIKEIWLKDNHPTLNYWLRSNDFGFLKEKMRFENFFLPHITISKKRQDLKKDPIKKIPIFNSELCRLAYRDELVLDCKLHNVLLKNQPLTIDISYCKKIISETDVFAGIQARRLYLHHNFISNCPNLKECSKLEQLMLMNNNLKSISNLISSIPHQIQILDLSFNHLKDETIDDIGKYVFKDMYYLNLKCNEFQECNFIPQLFPNLKYLNLDGNGFHTIPSWIEELTELEIVNLANNQLYKIRNFTSVLPVLKGVTFDANIPLEKCELDCNLIPNLSYIAVDKPIFALKFVDQLPNLRNCITGPHARLNFVNKMQKIKFY
jgi:Leucine-rich repeat (LRR) protein